MTILISLNICFYILINIQVIFLLNVQFHFISYFTIHYDIYNLPEKNQRFFFLLSSEYSVYFLIAFNGLYIFSTSLSSLFPSTLSYDPHTTNLHRKSCLFPIYLFKNHFKLRNGLSYINIHFKNNDSNNNSVLYIFRMAFDLL